MEQVVIGSWGNNQGMRITKNILKKHNLFIKPSKKILQNIMEIYRFVILIGESRLGERCYE